MPSKILLIENEQAFAGPVAESLEETGYSVRVTGDGKEGLELARDWSPDAIVLCVELPSMSGYLVCQKLKKDDTLKGIPLVLTSADATQETFDKHRTLKARADEYLLKPYEPAALAEKLEALVGRPDGAGRSTPAEAGDGEDEELVSLEVEMDGERAEGGPEAEIPALSLASLPDEPAGEDEPPQTDEGALDDDLRLLDDAFDGISVPGRSGGADAALDDPGERSEPGDETTSLSNDDENAHADAAALDETLGRDDEALVDDLPPRGDSGSSPRPARGASADLLRAAGIKLLDEEGAPTRASTAARVPEREPLDSDAADPEAGAGETVFREARHALERTGEELSARDAEIRALRRKLEAMTRRRDDAEAELERAMSSADAAQEQARKAEADQADLRRKLAEAEKRVADAERRAAAADESARRKADDDAATADALERELDELRTELLVARGEADGARGEIERRTAEFTDRISELEAMNAKNEERVVKAYQKIKADEKVRDKVRKALAIASQLLEEGLAPESTAEKDRPTVVGRE